MNSERFNTFNEFQDTKSSYSNTRPSRSKQSQSYGFQPIQPQQAQPQANHSNEMPNMNFSTRNSSNQNNNSNQHNQYVQQNQNNALVRKSFLRRLESIPIFSGETRSSLMEFIEICDSLFLFCQNENEYSELLMQVMIQLRGQARSALTECNQNDFEWPDIKDLLLKHFKYLCNRDVINSKLENLKQEKTESLTVFAERSRKLLLEKNNSYNIIT